MQELLISPVTFLSNQELSTPCPSLITLPTNSWPGVRGKGT